MQPTIRALDLVGLPPVMESTAGSDRIRIGLIDGPVSISHPDLVRESVREIPGRCAVRCADASSAACTHGTFVAGILCARRGSGAPAICPACPLLVRPIFTETPGKNGSVSGATPQELAQALLEVIEAGAAVINLSAALAPAMSRGERELQEALDLAARRGVLVVVAAGNQGTLRSSTIIRHPWVIPVAACDLQGKPSVGSNLGSSIGRRGLRAPGENITSLGAGGRLTLSGTSAAAPFVTGAIALLWSHFPEADAAELKLALVQGAARRASVVPPLLNAREAFRRLAQRYGRIIEDTP